MAARWPLIELCRAHARALACASLRCATGGGGGAAASTGAAGAASRRAIIRWPPQAPRSKNINWSSATSGRQDLDHLHLHADRVRHTTRRRSGSTSCRSRCRSTAPCGCSSGTRRGRSASAPSRPHPRQPGGGRRLRHHEPRVVRLDDDVDRGRARSWNDVIIVLVGNETDLVSQREVSATEIERASGRGSCSQDLRQGHNIKLLFEARHGARPRAAKRPPPAAHRPPPAAAGRRRWRRARRRPTRRSCS